VKEGQGKQALITHIYSLFSYSNPELSMVLDGIFRGVSKMSYGKSYFIRLLKESIFAKETQFRPKYWTFCCTSPNRQGVWK